MSGLDLPARAIREQIANSVHLVVQQSRFSDGSRRMTAITEVIGIDDNFEVQLRPIFEFYRYGHGRGGQGARGVSRHRVSAVVSRRVHLVRPRPGEGLPMNASATQLAPLAWLGVVLFAIGVAVALYITLTDEESPLAKLYFRYAAHLDGELRALFLHDVKGTTIVNWQLGVGFTSLVFDPVYTLLVGESSGVPIALIGIPIVAAAPALWFIDARHKRQEKIEAAA
jgi:hypothetical protein